MEVVQPIDVGPTNETKGKALGLTRLDATGDQPVGEQLRAALMHNFSRVVDLFRDWDDDRNGTVSRKEFRMVLPVLGLSVPRSEADALFSSIDVDGSGTIEYAELHSLLRAGATVELDASLYAGAAGEILLESSNATALRGGVLKGGVSGVLGGAGLG